MQGLTTAALHAAIPLLAAMAVHAEVQPTGFRLHAPLAPNRNDKATAFGGSVAALATAAGWGETCRQIAAAGLGEDWDVVVQSGDIQYLRPITTAFTAIASPPEDAALGRFTHTLARRGVGRLALTVRVEDASGRVCARFKGEYVAQRRPSRDD